MSDLLAILYGLIQGVAEFLPISSSGHLALLPFLGHFDDPGVFFDLSLHLGTALAVIIYFYKDLIELFNGLLHFVLTRKQNQFGNFAINLLAATVATFVVVMLLKKVAFDYGRSNGYIAFNLIFFGIVMALSDRFGKSGVGDDIVLKVKLPQAIIIGVSQALAIFPGVSRSGITITTARWLGVSLDKAGRFSFLLSLPIILGGFIFELPEAIAGGHELLWRQIFIGVVSSFVCGIVTIHFFLKLLKQIGLFYFMIYRVLLGIVIISLIYSN